ncbi:ABC transporter permease [Hahella sp. KA22]|uniref:ABC transporter permease n=1 Tax=Hahella sp. KA22 TaxID=1628392 RepID=UPI000FDCEB1A|nr:ABC transporter permease [Hahella sp. KA22]AZZ90904.1 ABC transporter permease [Hahella sp. KA22]QAY54274.1 ABC transporter permease [Hahella sp. KA22]
MNNNFDFIIRPNKKVTTFISEIWEYRDLFYFLALRDFKVRYKQTIVGSLWAILRPLMTMLVFTIVFGKIAALPSQGQAPYSILVFSAMLPWFFFSSSFQDGSNALVSNANMISKIYFPRIIIPISSLFVNAVDFIISFFLLLLLMIFLQYPPTYKIIALPVFFLISAAFTGAAIIWMSALNVKYRDIRYIIPFIVQFGLFISPVGFSSTVMSNEWRYVYSLNPLVGIIDGFRWSILDENVSFYWPGFFLSIFVTIALLFTGYLYFRKTENKFADII